MYPSSLSPSSRPAVTTVTGASAPKAASTARIPSGAASRHNAVTSSAPRSKTKRIAAPPAEDEAHRRREGPPGREHRVEEEDLPAREVLRHPRRVGAGLQGLL